MDHANVLKNVHRFEAIVRECILFPKKIHENVRRLNDLDDIEKYFLGFKAFIDATEQEIPRSRDKRRRRHSFIFLYDLTTDIVSGLINMRVIEMNI